MYSTGFRLVTREWTAPISFHERHRVRNVRTQEYSATVWRPISLQQYSTLIVLKNRVNVAAREESVEKTQQRNV